MKGKSFTEAEKRRERECDMLFSPFREAFVTHSFCVRFSQKRVYVAAKKECSGGGSESIKKLLVLRAFGCFRVSPDIYGDNLFSVAALQFACN